MRISYDQYLGARSRQEDYIAKPVYLDGRGVLVVLADGMGGHDDGHRASRCVAESFTEAVRNGATLADALQNARRTLASQKQSQNIAQNAGCTLVAVLANPHSFTFLSVGDSYIIHKPGVGEEDGKMHIVNELHTLGWKLVQEKRITREQAEDKKYAALVSAVTGGEMKYVSSGTRSWAPGDRLVLASDGILTFGLSTIGKLLRNNPAAAGKRVTPLVREMLDSVERYYETHRNKQDNTSVLLLENGAAGPGETPGMGYMLIEAAEVSRVKRKRNLFNLLISGIAVSLLLVVAAALFLYMADAPASSGTEVVSIQPAGEKPAKPKEEPKPKDPGVPPIGPGNPSDSLGPVLNAYTQAATDARQKAETARTACENASGEEAASAAKNARNAATAAEKAKAVFIEAVKGKVLTEDQRGQQKEADSDVEAAQQAASAAEQKVKQEAEQKARHEAEKKEKQERLKETLASLESELKKINETESNDETLKKVVGYNNRCHEMLLAAAELGLPKPLGEELEFNFGEEKLRASVTYNKNDNKYIVTLNEGYQPLEGEAEKIDFSKEPWNTLKK